MHCFSRCSITLGLIALMSGCSLMGGGDDAGRSNDCRWNRSNCMYEGSYEKGEREYAEEEARRLNRAEQGRLRRSR